MIDKIEINLIPASRAIRDRRFSISPKYLIPAIITIVLVVGTLSWNAYLSIQITRVETKIANTRRQIDVNRRIQDEIRTLTGIEREITVKVTALKSIDVNRSKWIDALELYSRILPPTTWLTSIEEEENRVTITGMTEAVSEVGQLMSRLYGDENVGGVDLVEMRDAGNDGQLKSFTLRHTFVNHDSNQNENQ